jgi:hypothetical protein
LINATGDLANHLNLINRFVVYTSGKQLILQIS